MVEKLPVFLHIFLHGECITSTSSVVSLAHKSRRCNKTAQMFDDASNFQVNKKCLLPSRLLLIFF